MDNTNRKFSLVITTYNRFDNFLKNTLVYYLQNSYFDEIVIYDDCSDDYAKICERFVNEINSGKIKIYTQTKNVGALKNKICACLKATNEWICLMDSDNLCETDYITHLIQFWNTIVYSTNVIYQPERGLPAQNFSKYIGITVDKSSWNSINDECLLNNGNYVLHKSILPYVVPILDETIETYAIDVKYMNYYWVKNGVSIMVVPNMTYHHTIHPGSLYINTCAISDNFNQNFNWKM
jgi:glycosyltransferase involved in cell wall biosynthesis